MCCRAGQGRRDCAWGCVMCHHRSVESVGQRGSVDGNFWSYPVGCDRTCAGWGDVARPGPFSRVWLPPSDAGPRRRGVVRRCVAVYGGRIGRAPYFAERELRPPGTGGLLRSPRCDSGPYPGCGGLPCGKLGPREDLISCYLVHARRASSLRRGHATSESAATLVWIGSYRFNACFAVLGNVLRDRVVRSDLGGVGLRTVVTEEDCDRAARARDLLLE